MENSLRQCKTEYVEEAVILFLSANRANVTEISYSVPVMNPETFQLLSQCHIFYWGEGICPPSKIKKTTLR
jgi:hypothetical protein